MEAFKIRVGDMPSRLHRLLLRYLSAAVFFQGRAFGELESKFTICKLRLDRILNGTETFRGISNETIEDYIYRGPVGGMKPEYAAKSRDKFITITTEGCKVICEDPIDWYWASDISLTLGIVSNWILPIIALLAALPYDSAHGRNGEKSRYRCRLSRARKTIWELLNWLGSPQTALTATFFNIHQIRVCLDAAKSSKPGIPLQRPQRAHDTELQHDLQSLEKDAYYVLCCIGQFKLPPNTNRFAEILVYGLFKPICNRRSAVEDDRNRAARRWSAELLRAMARQMRRSRCRGVWSTFASILLFFIAYGVAVVLAFGDLGERTTTHSLAFGILISWFPLLILFAVLDRNPNSADRTRMFIFRWMWNVRAVKEWEDARNANDGDRTPPQDPDWWSPIKEHADRIQNGQLPHDPLDKSVPSEFVGQGRQIGYNGLAYAVVASVNKTHETNLDQLARIIDETKKHLDDEPPRSWWVLSLAALALIWWDIGMAIMISFNIPTVGIGCRSGSYIIYGLLSTIPWFLHLFARFRRQGHIVRMAGHLVCGLSTLCLVVIFFAAFSGILKNCTCRGGLNAYLDFESAEFYRNPEHFNVKFWWVAAATTGAFPVALSFLAGLFSLFMLRPLWRESELGQGVGLEEVGHEEEKADMHWLD